jgi:hypothetical protein
MNGPWQKFFPLLEKLVFSPSDLSLPSWPHALSFPDTLTHLEVVTISFGFALLPHTLRVLKMGGLPLDDLPPLLQSLSFCLENMIQNGHEIGKLPSTLTELEFYGQLPGRSFLELSRQLSPTITSLHLQTPLAPSQDTRSLEISFSSLVHLRRLRLLDTELTRDYWDNQQVSFAEDAFPHNLEEFHFQLYASKVKITLPSLLRTFTLSCPGARVIRLELFYPKDGQLIFGLPPHLQSLELPSLSTADGPTPIDAFLPLPQQLTILNLQDQNELSKEQFYYLPSSLTEMRLNLRRPGRVDPSQAFSLVFPNLTSLRVTGPFNLLSAILKTLPRGLSSIYLEMRNKNRKLDEAVLCDLPLNLSVLHLVGQAPVFKSISRLGLSAISRISLLENLTLSFDFLEADDADLALLPRPLRELCLFGSTRLTGLSFAYLPRYLHVLSLQGLEMATDEDFSLLPRGLYSALLPRLDLNGSCYDYVPTTLAPNSIDSFVRNSDNVVKGRKSQLKRIVDYDIDPRISTNSFNSHNAHLSHVSTPGSYFDIKRREQLRKWKHFAIGVLILALALPLLRRLLGIKIWEMP